MSEKSEVAICWLRRDLRLNDNAALYYAMKQHPRVLILFIFDRIILDQLVDRDDARVTFIHHTLENINLELHQQGSSLLVEDGQPDEIWKALLDRYSITDVYVNEDYEPYARERDAQISSLLADRSVKFHSFKDQVIFSRNELLKDNGTPYSVFTPYYKRWLLKLNEFYVQSYPSEKYLHHLRPIPPKSVPELSALGFQPSTQTFPSVDFEHKLSAYEEKRDFPGADATSRLGIHLRFGTISIRQAAQAALEQRADKWLSELAWRDFYMMILWHFPYTVNSCFKPDYNRIQWRNNEQEFEAWCAGRTGYPLVDAGMRQLNETGYLHNRVRMVVASFLTKHLLIDWRWGETYFARKLLDYDQASNVGGWQWACGCGNDAAPYFRVFNPTAQAKKFDPDNQYIYRWAPEYKTQKHGQPIVEHAFARDRMLEAFKEALNPS